MDIPLVLNTDAMSVYAAASATFIKTPADQSLLWHVQYLGEMLDNGVVSAIVWLGARDITSDARTKGAVSRDALIAIMDGNLKFVHAAKVWPQQVFKH